MATAKAQSCRVCQSTAHDVVGCPSVESVEFFEDGSIRRLVKCRPTPPQVRNPYSVQWGQSSRDVEVSPFGGPLVHSVQEFHAPLFEQIGRSVEAQPEMLERHTLEAALTRRRG